MSTQPIWPGDRIAVTATWLIKPNDIMGTPAEAAAAWRSDPARALMWLALAERWPVSVSARLAHDLKQPDTAVEPAAPGDRPPPPDLFFGPELAGEALRRIAEADRYQQRNAVTGGGSLISEDGNPIVWQDAAEVAEHMRVTALALATLAGVAARLGPDFGGRTDRWDQAWTAALSAVEALIPPPAEEPLDEALVAAVQAGGAAAWQQHHDTAESSETEDGAR